jgi:hypothetical protein
MGSCQIIGVISDVVEARAQRASTLRLLTPTLVLALPLLVGIGCSGTKVTSQSSSELPRYHVRTIALLPFTTLSTPQVRDSAAQFMSAPPGAKRSDISLDIPSSVEPPLRQTTAVPEYAAEKITQLFWSRLKNRPGLVILSAAESAKALAQSTELPAHVRFESGKVITESEAAALATKLKADTALIGQVLVYQERSGSKLGADPPATVGFEVKAVAADGKVLWVGNYYERQQPMTQDLLGYIQHGGVFVTAEELAEYGVDKVIKTFPFGTGE